MSRVWLLLLIKRGFSTDLISIPPQSIESRLKLILPEDLGPFLMDGVVLCHLANHLHPCSVAGIHVPSPAAVGLLLSVRQWMPPPRFHFYRLCLFPAQTRHGQVSAKCGELPGGLQETGGTRGKTAICPVSSVFPQFVSSVNWGPFSCLFSPLIFTSVNFCESGTWRQLAPWAANAAILPSIKLLVTDLAEMTWRFCWGKSIEGNQIEDQQIPGLFLPFFCFCCLTCFAEQI